MNVERCIELEIDDINLYKELENKYKKYFEKNLMSKVDLSKYDYELITSSLDFGNINKSIKLFSNLNEYFNLNHIYLLNNFFVEKLTKDELDILKSDNEKELLKLVENTYKEVIKNNYNNEKYNENVYKICYGLYPTPENLIDNNSLVLIIYYGKNNRKFGKEGYIDNYRKKREFLKEISAKIEDEISKKLEIPVKVLFEKII